MRALAFVFIVSSFCISTAGAVSRRPASVSKDVKIKLLKGLSKSQAYTGAVAEVKAWSGAASCDVPSFLKIDKDSFELIVNCSNPGDPKAEAEAGVGLEATGQIHVYGIFYDAPDHPMIEKIEFSYAG